MFGRVGRVRIIKFLISGLAAATVEYIVFIVLQQHVDGDKIVISQSVSFLSGFVLSFSLNKFWVFKSEGGLGDELLRYISLLLINLMATNIIIHALINYTHLDDWVAKIIVMIMVAAWNYVIFQKLVFNRNHS